MDKLHHFSILLTRIRRYSEIRTAQVNHLLGVWLSGSEEESKTVRAKLEEKIDSFAAGGLEHAVDAISAIWEISNKEGPVPSDTPQSIMMLSIDFDMEFTGCDMRPSLIKSIQKGYLFDRKYWVRRSREGAIEPVYFPSIVTETELSGLGACKSPYSGVTEILRCTVSQYYLGYEGHIDRNDEDEYIEDSDHENEPEPAGEPVSQNIKVNFEQKLERKLLLVLSIGSPIA